MTHGEYLQFLLDSGYSDIKLLNAKNYAAIIPRIFTVAIIKGRLGDTFGFDDGWCYHNHDSAKKALEEWDGTGEPKGWHRHPASGRRRENGVTEKEYIEF